MSVYFKKRKGWRYDFTHKGARHTKAWYKTKAEAKRAEAKRKEELTNPKPVIMTPTGMDFLELVNNKLDYVKTYNSRKYYDNYACVARNWAEEWNESTCNDITADMIQAFVLKRAKVSHYTANNEICYLRALFNFGIKKGRISENPTNGIEFLPIEKKFKYVPLKEDVFKVILTAEPDTQDYLWTIKETMGRMGEINRLTWNDVNFTERYVVLYTRKKKGGDLTPRKVAMTGKLFDVLSHRYARRDKSKPWVFWHRYWSKKEQDWVEGPYMDRPRIMKTLCRKTGVKYFRFHALRHFGASILDNANVGIGSIQRILGHEKRSTTEIYVHSIGEAEREAMAIYEEACQDSHTNPHTDV